MIAKKIMETRKAQGLTQEELAEQSQVNIRTIQRIENGASEPRGKTLKLISEALGMETAELLARKHPSYTVRLAEKLTEGFFLIILNIILMSVIGFLTLDSNANINSRLGAFLLSFFMPFFIVILTRKMREIERMLKFGSGLIVYFILVLAIVGIPAGLITGLLPCLVLAMSTLYYGESLRQKLSSS